MPKTIIEMKTFAYHCKGTDTQESRTVFAGKLVGPGFTRKIAGQAECTNQRGELLAVLETIKAIPITNARVNLLTRSSYVFTTFCDLRNIVKRQWKTRFTKENVAHLDLLQEIVRICTERQISIYVTRKDKSDSSFTAMANYCQMMAKANTYGKAGGKDA